MQRATEPPNLLASSGSRSCGRLMDVRILLRIEELVNPAILRGEHARGTGSAPQVEPCVFAEPLLQESKTQSLQTKPRQCVLPQAQALNPES